MGGGDVEAPFPLTGWKKHFNSYTIYGRRNVSLFKFYFFRINFLNRLIISDCACMLGSIYFCRCVFLAKIEEEEGVGCFRR